MEMGLKWIVSVIAISLTSSVIAVPYESELLGRTLDIPVVPFEKNSFLTPSIGTSNTVYLGDNMIWHKTGYFALCLNVIEAYRSKHINFTEGEICKLDDRYNTWYTRDGRSLIKRPGGHVVDQDWAKKVSIEKDKKGLKVCSSGVFGGSCIKKMDPSVLVESDSSMLIDDFHKFQQGIEYLGKDGDLLRFTYFESKRADIDELTNNRRKNAELSKEYFTREFVVDLSEDNIVAFRGAIIEVEKATSSRITYKIIRNFSNRKSTQ
ncbi:hypothetical protein OAR36_06780 [Pseudomonadales bacterium]|nr:hypothetical protein [Pseudomonadales bacterium]